MEPQDPLADGSDDPWIGQTLAGYTILRRIGAGGMGIVYLARHNSLERLAAVKFLPATMANDAAFIELFLREAKAAAKLRHPNIVDVYDAGHLGEDIYYFIMEFVEGKSLDFMLKEHGKLPIREAVEYVRQAASALAYAHGRQIIHRDIKPDNLLLTTEGVIRVVDLGLAKWTGEESGMMTQTGDILGSPIYIAPERLSDPQANHPGTDVYSLGCTLFHLVTGRTPYEGTVAVIISKHLTDEAPDPHSVNPEVDAPLAAIIMKMMAKNPAERYTTMGEVEAALSAWLAGKSGPQLAAAPSSGGAKWLWPAAIVVLLGLGAGGYFLMPRSSKPEKAAEAVQPPSGNIEKPSAQPSTPAKPSGPTFVIADFDTDSRVNRVKGNFGVKGSTQPTGWCSERLMPYAGAGNTGCWQVEFNISAAGSSAVAWMRLQGFDASGYDTLRAKFHTENDAPMSFVLELKADKGGSKIVHQQKVTIPGRKWVTVDFPLAAFDADALKSLSELNLLFNGETTGAGKGSLEIDMVELVKMK